MRVQEGFQAPKYVEGHAFTDDPALPALLKRILPPNVYSPVAQDLTRLGEDIVKIIQPLGQKVDKPTLIQFDHFGQRVDELHTSEGWRELKAVFQREGVSGIPYERQYGEYSRVYGFAKIMMITGDTHHVSCPFAMTDGAARLLEISGNEAVKRDVFSRLTSRDPSLAFTSGQWMTERPGGSDVSQTETIATPTGKTHAYGQEYKLNGFKWFSSATDSDVALALARTDDSNHHLGARGLSLFLVPLHLPLLTPGSALSNNILIHRLKDKFGTHAVPTAELELASSTGYLIGPLNQGVKTISPILNITRVFSAITSLGSLRKCLSIATAYANVRTIASTGKLLRDAPMHVASLAHVNVSYQAILHLVFGVVKLLGKAECDVATNAEKAVLRALTPVMKAFAAEIACVGAEECMTALGGLGYMEEVGIGRIIRDVMVERIWEGTTAVLALDLVRAAKDPLTISCLTDFGRSVLTSAPKSSLLDERHSTAVKYVAQGLEIIPTLYHANTPELVVRPALMLVAHVFAAVYLLEHAVWSLNENNALGKVDLEVFTRWVLEGGLVQAMATVREVQSRSAKETKKRVEMDKDILFGTRSSMAKL